MAGIYIHIPYCHSKCAYCDFYSMPRTEHFEQYVTALIDEWHSRINEISEPIETIYIGGGTPSILPPATLDRLIRALPLDNVTEFTIEANPEDVTKEFSDYIARQTPINRVSMGIQSFVDDELKLIGRRHSADEAIKAIERLKQSGIGNISGDLIYGLPLQNIATWQHSLDTLLSLNLTHISCYLLSYEQGTRLYAMRLKGNITEASESEAVAYYDFLCRTCAARGYEHYEISNFAQTGYRSKHNSGYWSGVPYIGLGTAAHSFDGLVRRYNPSNIKEYIAHKHTPEKPFFVIDEENESQRFNDFILTSLRTSRGMDLDVCERTFGTKRIEELLSSAARHIKSGNMQLSGRQLSISENMWLISDSIIIDLIEV